MNEDLSPSIIFTRLLRFWWALALLMILGGFFGLLLGKIHHPVYESQAEITSVADYSLVGTVDDWENDQVYVAIGDVIGSTSVKQDVIAQARTAKINTPDEEILNSLSLDRQDNRWVLHVRLNDPKLAQQINTYWANSAMTALESMKAKAVTGFTAQQYINALATCLQQSVVVEANSSDCNPQNFAQIQSEIVKVVNDPEMQLSSGSLLLLHTSFALTTQPTLPRSPVLFSQNILALAGMLVALVVGLILLSINFPTKTNENGKN